MGLARLLRFRVFCAVRLNKRLERRFLIFERFLMVLDSCQFRA